MKMNKKHNLIFQFVRLKLCFANHYRWLYWTEHKSGATGVEVFSCKNNGQRYRRLVSTDLHWPNSLVVDNDKLYIGDGKGKIIVTDLEGRFDDFLNPFINMMCLGYTMI